MAGIGLYLRQVREQQGYTLEDMNRITNIHIHYLQALEQDRYDLLPSPLYAKAFLRTYARSLGIDPKPIIDRFEQIVLQSQSLAPSSPRNTQRPNTLGKDQAISQPPYMNQTTSQNLHYPSHLTQQKHIHQQQQTYPSQYSQHVQSNSLLNQKSYTNPSTPRINHQESPYQTTSQSLPGLPPPETDTVKQEMQSHNMTMGTQSSTSAPTTLSSSPQFHPSLQQPLAPRRVVLEKKRSEERAAVEKQRSKNKKKVIMIGIAVSALLLIGTGAYFYFSEDAPQAARGDLPVSPSVNTGVNANEMNMPILEQGDISENPYEGQLYLIENVDKLEVVLKAKDGESTVLYAPTANDQPKEFTLKVGQVQTLDTAGKDHIWFRLGTPSNVEVSVNGQIINTEAQDTEKSYRVQLKK